MNEGRGNEKTNNPGWMGDVVDVTTGTASAETATDWKCMPSTFFCSVAAGLGILSSPWGRFILMQVEVQLAGDVGILVFLDVPIAATVSTYTCTFRVLACLSLYRPVYHEAMRPAPRK